MDDYESLTGSSMKGVGKTDFWVGLGSDRVGSSVSGGDARHRSFPVGAWVEVAVDGDAQRVCDPGWSAQFVRGFSAWEPVCVRRVRRRGLRGSRHEGRDLAASGLLPASHAVARSCASSDLSDVRGRKVATPWARAGSGFTLLFEAYVLALAKAMPIANAAKRLGEHDTRLWQIVEHYVWQAVEKLDLSEVRRIAADETSAGAGTTTLACSLTWRGAKSSTWPTARTPPR